MNWACDFRRRDTGGIVGSERLRDHRGQRRGEGIGHVEHLVVKRGSAEAIISARCLP